MLLTNEKSAIDRNAALVEGSAKQIMRLGKTAKDRNSGAARRCELNKQKRGAWENDKSKPFPYESTGGKRSANYRAKHKAARKGGPRKNRP